MPELAATTDSATTDSATTDSALTVTAELDLTPSDTAEVERLARGLSSDSRYRVDAPEWIARARDAWDEAPLSLRRAVRRFRRHSGPQGVLVIHGLPVDAAALPATPSTSDSVQREPTVASAVLAVLACGLGDPVAYRAEKSGALVQDVVPVPGKENFSGNAGSALLTFHNENAFHPHEPDHVLLLCLRADHDRVAGLRTACLREALPLLPEATRDVLSAPEFILRPPPSFGTDDTARAPQPVLSGADDDPDIRIAQIAVTALTPRAEAALAELAHAFDTAVRTTRLAPGDMAVVDNRVTVHGRTPFRPRYDGADRWVQRTFALTDLRRSRDHRPDDGYVLAR
ncbi:TauD/TfdA family dioxygenase [Actinosynnema sp. NPDC023587]|uniref:TauD/TfdA family dioxygenase n=1 Tax=Actinosynnema sp. NPDC023587 TaxID=3154695 RepID=UPI0033D8277D